MIVLPFILALVLLVVGVRFAMTAAEDITVHGCLVFGLLSVASIILGVWVLWYRYPVWDQRLVALVFCVLAVVGCRK